MYDTTDTIAAIATPLGESGIGVIRISGSHAYAVGDAIFRSPSGTPLAQRRDRSIQHGLVVADDGRPVDEVLMLIMKGPHSYTAEDVLEIQCHGGRKALEEILAWSWPTAPAWPIPENLRSGLLSTAASIWPRPKPSWMLSRPRAVRA